MPQAGQNADNQLTLWGSQGFLYDLNGNMTADGNNAYAWNVRNQLVALTPDGGTASTFVYDALGRRQTKVINGVDTEYIYDLSGNLTAEMTSDGGAYTAVDLAGEGLDELTCRYTAGPDGGLNQPLVPIVDINGSIAALLSDGGVIQSIFVYEPYGATTLADGGNASGDSQQYAGRENDGTGLYYNRDRYYMPGTGRFVSEDPLGHIGGVNLYQYAGGNPVQFNDPLGQDCSYYTLACQAAGGLYYCWVAPGACRAIPPLSPQKWGTCVQQCLQDCDAEQQQSNPNPPLCPPTGPPKFQHGPQNLVQCHLSCWQNCT